jgi:transglutaminase-like putative cysteine protease
MSTLRVRAGARFSLSTSFETPAVFIIRPENNATNRIVEERWSATPYRTHRDYTDLYGNSCRRLQIPGGETFVVDYDVLVETTDALDPYEPTAQEIPIENVPDDALVFTLPSRYCLSDMLSGTALDLFGDVEPGWNRVQAICDFVHNHIRFQYGSSSPTTTSLDVYHAGVGVCRDFAHLSIAFCRALNIPARYAFGYMPDIDVPNPILPMDFCAWFEVYLGGKWWIFDARNNERRKARLTIARGRDALDVAMLTTYGNTYLNEMIVIADPAEDDAIAR